MAYHLLNVLTLLFLITCAPHANYSRRVANPAQTISDEDRSTIENGLLAGTALAVVLKEGDFKESLKALGTKLTPFLTVLGPLASIAIAFVSGGDSAELVYMREKFDEVTNKLDIVTAEFTEVKNAIEWSTVSTSYGTYERKIRAAQENLDRVYEVEGDAREFEKQNFITQYDSDFQNSVQKLYDVTVSNDHMLSNNILEAVVRQTKNHKRKIEKFSLGLVQLLLQGIKIKISYYGMNGQDAAYVITEWQTKMNTLKDHLQTLSDTAQDSYLNQMKRDTRDIILRHHGLGNQGLLDMLFNFVTEKYDWRFWFVAVYDDMIGADNHNMWQCGGICYLHEHDKNIIIASQDKADSTFNRRNAENLVEGVVERELAHIRDCPFVKDRAFSLVESTKRDARVGDSCLPYSLRLSVLLANNDFVYRNSESRIASQIINSPIHCCSRHQFLCIPQRWNHIIIVFG